MTELGVENEAFAADHLFGADPSPRPRYEPVITETQSVRGAAPAVDLDAGRDEPSPPTHPNAGAKKTALWLVGAVVAAVVAIVGVLTGSTGADPTGAEPAVRAVPAPVAPVAAPSTASTAPDQDRAIAYTASANCPAGSTSARSLSDATGDSAWTCVRGQQGARVDGQVLHVQFDGSHVVSAVSVTPGWVPHTPGGPDQWLRHRVVSRLQYVFDDADRTIFTQDTGNVHGPVTAALPRRVLASRVTVIVLQTSRPPASPAPNEVPATPPPPGFGGSLLAPWGPTPPTGSELSTDPFEPADGGDDPVDATFAISALTFLGHPPR